METILDVEGMTCSGCARNVREALAGVEGVELAEVDLEGKNAVVTWAEQPEAPVVGRGGEIEGRAKARRKAEERERAALLVRAVKQAGYGAKPRREREPGEPGRVDLEPAERTGSLWSAPLFFLGIPVTVTLMVAEWGFDANNGNAGGGYGWLAFALALPVQIGLGFPFYRNAWRQLFRNRLTMDTLVSLGSTAAFGLSLYELVGFVAGGSTGHLHVSFLESSSILTLVGAGHWLEGRLATRSGAALRALLRSVPQSVLRFPGRGGAGGPGEAVEVPLASLAKGDLVLVKPGDRIPIDGEIVEGYGAIDESLLTGESLPAEKGPGFPVRAGTFNTDGRLVVRVDGLGSETALAGIVRAVERAQSSRAEIERLVDRVSRYFVLVVITLAILTFFGWGFLSAIGWEASLLRAVAVLVVACPCAMGLATPAALMAAANAASRRGILFRDASAIEKTGKIDTVLFDKTGTLTGELTVKAVEFPPRAKGEAPVLPPSLFPSLVRALAAPSHHPLCRALVHHYPKAAPLAVEGWREERGAGVVGRCEGRTARLGSPAWLIASGVVFPDAFLPRLGGGPLALAIGEEVAALITFVKPVRREAAAVIRGLEKDGYAVYMVTGDEESPALAVAQEVGIKGTRVYFGIRPEEKADLVVRMRAVGEGRKEKRVAFVGDGINDGPALAAADLGIAVLGASDVAREASDMVLLTRDLEAVPEALRLSAATLRVIRENLFWAFFYNAAMVPLAMIGMVPAVACALAMGLSDLCVMGNAMRLLRYGRKVRVKEVRS
ncbi:Cu+-exporting ATPase [Verrucomicrobium sp. GAS474]|uniref:heavy metal translocating P-type ATPase n=1 Tax=Verrucomicrobium sp. GAS474 TaxID=1882831 RepID=UPI000879BBF4|nr:cation-translocating P-type ATPase [Verrucomicrobium sp. GAS474]SDT99282.1 Cu+-exporting ATPase [Verrucomicrobium sp. GAS474]